ncbi:MAG: hypothetical protein K9G83_07220, partial [Hyphomonadaceae bacterium]|nr:hypothetical protein [Hyphomonadaceae bacterium]
QAKLARQGRQHGGGEHRIAGADGEKAEEQQEESAPPVRPRFAWPRCIWGGAGFHPSGIGRVTILLKRAMGRAAGLWRMGSPT